MKQALKNAVSIYGPGNWVKIQQYVLGRTDVQCRERWMNVLSPEIKKDPWTNEVNIFIYLFYIYPFY